MGIINGFNSFWCNEYKFVIQDIESVLSLGFLEEITEEQPVKNLVLTEENKKKR